MKRGDHGSNLVDSLWGAGVGIGVVGNHFHGNIDSYLQGQLDDFFKTRIPTWLSALAASLVASVLRRARTRNFLRCTERPENEVPISNVNETEHVPVLEGKGSRWISFPSSSAVSMGSSCR